MAVLAVENVSFRYRNDWVLRDVSFTVDPGEFIGILGPNGSGKTTLLKVMDGLLEPQEGKVAIDGRPIRDMSRNETARIIAVVPQDAETVFSFTVAELVLMGRSPHLGMMSFEGRRDYSVVAHALELTGLSGLADRRLNALSGGERQRVLIARALAQEPKILLLDEPTAFLDIRHQVEILDLAGNLNRTSGVTVVAITHDINLASSYCSRIAMLKEGSVHCLGVPDAVITEDHIRSVYGIDVIVDKHPVSASPRVTTIRSYPSEQGSRCETGAAPQL